MGGMFSIFFMLMRLGNKEKQFGVLTQRCADLNHTMCGAGKTPCCSRHDDPKQNVSGPHSSSVLKIFSSFVPTEKVPTKLG